MMQSKNSQLSNFYKKTSAERLTTIQEWAALNSEEAVIIQDGGLGLERANNMVENVIGTYKLPMGIATNFLINQQDYLIPMVIEEPSVIAAVSKAAKMFRAGGGFTTSSSAPITIGQLQILDLENITDAIAAITRSKAFLLSEVNKIGGSIIKQGGGAQDLEIRILSTRLGEMLILHLLYDTRDAMGANAVNTALEHIAPYVAEITGGRVNLRILSNLSDHRTARAEGRIPLTEFAEDEAQAQKTVQSILEAAVFAEADPYRATTHNKGIMNGIDAVVIATGNDWRAVEAGAHAFAARSGSYTSLTRWWQDTEGNLHGAIELPMAIGTVGGATRVHPSAQIALRILGVQSGRELAEVIAAVGLAQNFAAMRALATEGIQQGHMRMHARQLAVAAGASDTLVPQIVEILVQEKNIRLERATELVQQLQKGSE